MIAKWIELQRAIKARGFVGTAVLLLRKRRKAKHLASVITELRRPIAAASLPTLIPYELSELTIPEVERQKIVEQATSKIGKINFFSFSVPLSAENVWQLDPLENRHWPKRQYSERSLHATDTPGDVKIVWEVNRFTDLPILAQGYYLTKNPIFEAEISKRLISWIHQNPVGQTINWASGLELAVRLMSWTASLILLQRSGSKLYESEDIRRSIYQHIRYLDAELSTDKIVTSNHLIGEAAAMFVCALLWQDSRSASVARRALTVLTDEILKQTYADGATREATTWYHQFVTDFASDAMRSAERFKIPFDAEERVRLMRKFLLSAKAPDGSLIRLGDADDGLELPLAGESERWKNLIFGPLTEGAETEQHFWPESHYAAIRQNQSYLFIRGGEFGMGGAGFSSHAHDDQLSPIFWLAGEPVLVDPGTFIYNGNISRRAKYRGRTAHNSIEFADAEKPLQKFNFGWTRVLPSARLEADSNKIRANFGDLEEIHSRTISLEEKECVILDELFVDAVAQWNFHLHPQWQIVTLTASEAICRSAALELRIRFEGQFSEPFAETYDFSPSYRVAMPATKLRLSATTNGTYQTVFTISQIAGNTTNSDEAI